MATAEADISAGGGGIDLTRLIAAISPILLGSGRTTGGTASSSASSSDQTQTSTTQKNADPGTLAALLGIAGNAANNAQNPDITNQIVQNIFRQSAEAFAPTVGTAASTGLYNTSTLGLLSDDARARAVAQSAQAVLGFQTSQQQIASGALTSVLGATGSTTTTTDLTNNTKAANTGSTFNITAPSLGGAGLLQSVGGIAASVLGKKALDAVSPYIKDKITDPLMQALGLGDSGFQVGGGGDAVITKAGGGFVDDSNFSSPAVETATTAGSSEILADGGSDGLTAADLATANGIAPGTAASDITISGASDLATAGLNEAGTAESLSAPTVDIAAAASPDISSTAGSITPAITTDTAATGLDISTPGIGATFTSATDAGTAGLEGAVNAGTEAGTDLSSLVGQAGSGLVDFGSSVIDSAGNFVSDLAANSGDIIAGGLGSLGLGEAFKGAFGPEVGNDLGLATSGVSAISGELGGPTIGSLTGDLAGAASGALGLTAAASGAGLEAAGGFATLGALEGAADAGILGTAALGAGVGEASALGVGIGTAAEVGGAAAGGLSLTDAAIAVAALAGWVVCTELTRQGKIPTKIYRAALKRFRLYNHWGVRGYHKWGIPLKNYVRDNPDTRFTSLIAYLFLKRAHNLALLEGCPDAKWSVIGAITTSVCYWISAGVGIYLGFKCAWKQKRILNYEEIFTKFDKIHTLVNINNGGI